MSTVLSAQRVAVLIDVQNMFHSAYDCFHGRLNYRKLAETVAARRQVTRSIAFAVQDGNDQASFFSMLREAGFDVRAKAPRIRPDGSRKGGWDLGIAIEALSLAPKVDAIALVSGDGDFVELADALRARGVRVEVYAFERSVGRALREAADLFVPIGEDLIFQEAHQDDAPKPEKAEKVEAPRKPVERKRPEPKKVEVEEEDDDIVDVEPVDPPAEEEAVKPTPPAPKRSSGFGAGLLGGS